MTSDEDRAGDIEQWLVDNGIEETFQLGDEDGETVEVHAVATVEQWERLRDGLGRQRPRIQTRLPAPEGGDHQ